MYFILCLRLLFDIVFQAMFTCLLDLMSSSQHSNGPSVQTTADSSSFKSPVKTEPSVLPNPNPIAHIPANSNNQIKKNSFSASARSSPVPSPVPSVQTQPQSEPVAAVEADYKELPIFLPNALVVTGAAALLESIGELKPSRSSIDFISFYIRMSVP